tara:strand:- start:3 stop:119 length:117 start_codon:yes stop_codon:yes gene_type:complete
VQLGVPAHIRKKEISLMLFSEAVVLTLEFAGYVSPVNG